MELDHVLLKVQGILKTNKTKIIEVQNVVKDDERDCKEIITLIKHVIKESNHKTQQKLYILLFLNTDLDICKKLKKNRKYVHLIGFFPQLSQYLFMKLILGLELQKCLYDSIVHFPSCLSYQVLQTTLKALHWDLFESVPLVENVLVSLYNKMTLMEEEDKYKTPFKETFQTLLLHYDAEKGGTLRMISQLSSHDMKHYAGLVVASMLSLLERCSNIFLKKEDDPNLDDFVLYRVQIDGDVPNTVDITSNESKDITVQKCYEHLVAKCLENICSITVDLWLFWFDVPLNDIPDTEDTLQRAIGEKAYTCIEVLREVQLYDIASKEVFDVITRLKNIALKPMSEEDKANSLELDQVINNITDPSKDSMKWLRILVNHTSHAVQPESLEFLKSRVNSLQLSDFKSLLKNIFDFIKISKDNTVHKNFILEIPKYLDFNHQAQLLVGFLESFGLSDILKTYDYPTEFVETFNKVISIDDKEKEVYSQFLTLALQKPDDVVYRAVREGIISEVRGHLMADILGRLQPVCDTPVGSNPLLVVALEELLLDLASLPMKEQTNYPLFVRELVMRKCLDGDKLIKGCLMSKMHLHLKSKDCIVLSACLETLSELCDINCIHNCPACLVMLMQIVETMRWSPPTFSMAAVHVCESALILLDEYITKWFHSEPDERQIRRFATMVEKCISPMNRYHLARLIPDEKLPDEPSLQLMYRTYYGIGEWSIEQITEEERTKLVFALCYVLPVLTCKEWQELFCVATPKCSEFILLFNIVTDSMLLCLDSTKANPDPAVLNCLKYAVLNLTDVVKNEVTRWNKSDNAYRIGVLSKMSQLIRSFSVSLQEEMGLTVVKVLQSLLPEGTRRQPLTEEEIEVTTTAIVTIRAGNVRKALARDFLQMISYSDRLTHFADNIGEEFASTS
ncbi:uncharacterized protein LOC124358235 [Homalodisca vitripennis]|uniref:uncharacterized protein LOC124358235 n=1 Tax=Homalodisca vitripennis TaxID=197043 RepID=UPI001EEB6522|nr:uncharacterized protein LOC124358235 [Homalodisca vitripennis]